MPTTARKILVIQTAYLGDAVLVSSLVEKLHQFFPGDKISLLLRKGNEGCYFNHPFLDQVFVWDKKRKKFAGLLKLRATIRKNKFDIVINVQRFFSAGFLAAFSGATEKIGFDRNPLSFLFTKKVKFIFGDGRHEVERNQELIRHLTDEKFSLPKLYPTKENFKKVEPYLEKSFVTMAPASVWFTKALPKEKWIELCNSIPPGTKIILTGSKSDFDLCETIRNGSTHPLIENTCGNFEILDTCALVSKATMNFVNDSAPLHFCSAMNAPVTAFFCSTLPSFGFYPLSSNSAVVEGNEKLDCRPCGIHGKKECPKGHFKCAFNINFDRSKIVMLDQGN